MVWNLHIKLYILILLILLLYVNTNEVVMKRATNFRLEEETLAKIILLAKEQSTTRTEIVERAIAAYARDRLAKRNRLMQYLGTLEAEEADEMLEAIRENRVDKDAEFNL
jgi:predicted transcriptional regulator